MKLRRIQMNYFCNSFVFGADDMHLQSLPVLAGVVTHSIE
uniref:Uncharacterized protein n=1 Tax=Klebsiella pneumoniae TaxID=573 RepID=A0A345WYN5_KLEPN|nr:hypothetical protein [Klebsiella pneumoniae]QKY82354.1 hypothetical protein [Escherichia coli]